MTGRVPVPAAGSAHGEPSNKTPGPLAAACKTHQNETNQQDQTHTCQLQLGRVNFSGASTNGHQKTKCYPRLLCEVRSAVGARATPLFTIAWDDAHRHRYEHEP